MSSKKQYFRCVRFRKSAGEDHFFTAAVFAAY